jgi:undecaprenyl-diphosphatase
VVEAGVEEVTLSLGEACLLGLVQGLTEFLPISSDGHLALLQRFLTPMPADKKLAIDVALHLGTLVAVLVYFRRDLIDLTAALVGRARNAYARSWVWLIVIGTVPAGVFGLWLRHRIEATYDSLWVIGLSFAATGALLFLAAGVRDAGRDEEKIDVRDALVIGCFQVLALLPGLSRSGSTIAAAIFRRIRPDVAARFSFLLGIPAIAGAVLTEAGAVMALGPEARLPLAAGVVTAAITGLGAIALLLRIVRGGKGLRYFSYYCWALAAVATGAAVARVA